MAKVLVTGSSDGIGKQTALLLSRGGAQVIVHGRSEARAAQAAREVPGSEPWVCDFESLDEVRAAAGRLPAGIDVLINNAGVLLRERRTTGDGYETTFQVNHLAPFLLTNLILPSMVEGSRIVNVSSQVHAGAEMAWEDLMGERSFSGYGAYGQSKLANLLFTASWRGGSRRPPSTRCTPASSAPSCSAAGSAAWAAARWRAARRPRSTSPPRPRCRA
jgi:NAD(P)-dependent dehydrogenase (short-subunit alcohol dehydrogenase family)